MNSLIYNIPAHRLPDDREGRLIVRASDPAELIAALTPEDPGRVIAVQLLNLDADSEPLNAWAPGLPIELLMRDPAAEFPLLYRHTNLLDNHPVQVAMTVAPGFGKAVKTAAALDFAVRLELEQPDPALIEELAAVLEFYLHQPTVAQPVEYFHGALLGFYHDEPIPLWLILDENPGIVRYIAADGTESLSGRLAGADLTILPDADSKTGFDQVLATAEECRTCEFLKSCGGYFKWPRRDYDCAGVKRVFGLLREAAAELRRDLAAVPTEQDL
ncbi:MAG: hypothetical protein LAE24_01895 [Candidatus Contendobacter sp.]|nr:hypothetical protein [Candidatus Contendobacter sp.]